MPYPVQSTVKTILVTLKMEAVMAVNQDGGMNSVIKACIISKIMLMIDFFNHTVIFFYVNETKV